MTDQERTTLVQTEQRSKSNSHRLDAVEEEMGKLRDEQKAIYKIAASVEVIADQTKRTQEEVKSMSLKIDKQSADWRQSEEALEEQIQETDHKVDELQNKPSIKIAENYEKIKVAVITALCSGAATLILTKLFDML